MPRNKRLHFKDINGLKAFVFFPIFLLCIFSLIDFPDNEFVAQLTKIIGYLVQNCIDFLFFTSAFLVTSHALREYKYTNSFSYQKFLLRRLLRLSPVLIIAISFAFFIYPWLERVLLIEPRTFISASGYALLIPNYRLDMMTLNLPIFMVVIASVFMFIQFYLVWGLVLRFFYKQLFLVSVILMVVGIIVRIFYVELGEDYVLDTFAYGVPLGLGSLTAQYFRTEHGLFEKLKNVSKQQNILIYCSGILLLLVGYLLVAKTWLVAFLPLLTGLFYGYAILDQTFGKNSFVQLKNKKALSYIGKISYGLIVYQSIVGVLIMIAVESLVADIFSVSTIAIILTAGLICTVIMADISYKLFEKPLLRLRREFKKV